MKVVVIYEFSGIEPDSLEADQIIDEIGGACETMQSEFGASACWVDDAKGD